MASRSIYGAAYINTPYKRPVALRLSHQVEFRLTGSVRVGQSVWDSVAMSLHVSVDLCLTSADRIISVMAL